MKEQRIKKIVREGYAKIARQESTCCAPAKSCGCGGSRAEVISRRIGYSDEEMDAVPDGANLGLGCGNPVALASLKKGEVVLDLGSGAGFDCFLAARRVGQSGKVIGVDMTPEMLGKARENARKGKYRNIEFRLGEIENLPVADGQVDVVISNCVINLAPDKARVFEEAYRVLKPGGRLMVSDIVLLKELPAHVRESVQAYVGCLSGAIIKDKYLAKIKSAGFEKIRVIDETFFPVELMASDATAKALLKKGKFPVRKKSQSLADTVASVKVSAIKPKIQK